MLAFVHTSRVAKELIMYLCVHYNPHLEGHSQFQSLLQREPDKEENVWRVPTRMRGSESILLEGMTQETR